LIIVNWARGRLCIIGGMKPQALPRLFLILLIGLLAAAAGAQTAPPGAAASNPMAALPDWAQAKLTESKDPKVHDRYYKEGRKVAEFCANCHGPRGQSIKPEVPNLAGQNTIYVVAQLVKFTEHKRRQFFMEGLMKALTPDEKIAVAIYYTNQEPKSVPVADAALAARGKALYEKGCYKCHGENGYGNEKNARLAGQGPEYLAANITRYTETGGPRVDEKMAKAVKILKEEDIKALVAYIGSMR
jgi:cytochrome c553